MLFVFVVPLLFTVISYGADIKYAKELATELVNDDYWQRFHYDHYETEAIKCTRGVGEDGSCLFKIIVRAGFNLPIRCDKNSTYKVVIERVQEVNDNGIPREVVFKQKKINLKRERENIAIPNSLVDVAGFMVGFRNGKEVIGIEPIFTEDQMNNEGVSDDQEEESMARSHVEKILEEKKSAGFIVDEVCLCTVENLSYINAIDKYYYVSIKHR